METAVVTEWTKEEAAKAADGFKAFHDDPEWEHNEVQKAILKLSEAICRTAATSDVTGEINSLGIRSLINYGLGGIGHNGAYWGKPAVDKNVFTLAKALIEDSEGTDPLLVQLSAEILVAEGQDAECAGIAGYWTALSMYCAASLLGYGF